MRKTYCTIVSKPNILKETCYLFTCLTLTITLFSLFIFGQTNAFAASFTYDSLNRLIKVDYGNDTVRIYTYDAAGNRLKAYTFVDTDSDGISDSGE